MTNLAEEGIRIKKAMLDMIAAYQRLASAGLVETLSVTEICGERRPAGCYYLQDTHIVGPDYDWQSPEQGCMDGEG